jgi:Holliday junction resolvase RusA-like endonuclease
VALEGEVIELDVEGRPAPKGSRIAARTKGGRSYTYPASRFEKPWVDAVKGVTMIVMRHHATLEPPYAVELEFRISPACKPRYLYPVQSDLDKLVRATLDGLVRGNALKDDSHVTVLTASKRYVRDGEPPGVHARFMSLAASAGNPVAHALN